MRMVPLLQYNFGPERPEEISVGQDDGRGRKSGDGSADPPPLHDRRRRRADFLGWFHLRREGRGAELGYRLRRAAWGRGYATEGGRALISHGFAVLGAEGIYTETMAVNAASRRVMEKAGLRYVRTFTADWPDRIPGDEEGDVEYALTRAEWETATWRTRRSDR